MSRITSQYPERVYSSATQEHSRRPGKRSGGGRISKGWMIAGLAAIGVGVWMVYHFGPDLARYMKMERM